MIARGEMLGKDQKVVLHLLDIPPAKSRLDAVAMELEDIASPVVAGVVATTDYAEAFDGVDIALLVGAMPRGKGMERKDLLEKNAGIFKGQGEALEKHASKDCKILVVGNPANTNCLLAAENAPSIPRKNFTALTRLDHNRLIGQVAKRAACKPWDVQGAIVWGNHSATQFPDARFMTVATKAPEGGAVSWESARTKIGEGCDEWMAGELVETVQKRGKAVIEARGASSAASAASAICDHVRDWMCGSGGKAVSMAVASEGNPYGIADGIFYSFPVVCEKGGKWTIVPDMDVSPAPVQERLKVSEKELLEERAVALGK